MASGISICAVGLGFVGCAWAALVAVSASVRAGEGRGGSADEPEVVGVSFWVPSVVADGSGPGGVLPARVGCVGRICIKYHVGGADTY